MKHYLTTLLFFCTLCAALPTHAQRRHAKANEAKAAAKSTAALLEKYHKGEAFYKAEDMPAARSLFKEIMTGVPREDTLYGDALWYYINATAAQESMTHNKGDFKAALPLALEVLQLLRDHQSLLANIFEEREAWAIKNIVLCYSGLGQYDSAATYRALLYQKNKTGQLPEGLKEQFNFDFFKTGQYNVWGYEWYDELPENRLSSSFTKIIYYVYSTDAAGADKDQVCRYHVLMFHKQSADEVDFDYLLEKQEDLADKNISGSYYDYTYQKNIDYKKLHNDVLEIISKQIQPDTRRERRL